MSSVERRKSARLHHAFLVRYRLTDRPGMGWRTSPIRDLSTTGIRFFSEFSFPQDSRVDVWVLLPHATQPVSVKGNVVRLRRVRPEGEGLTEYAVAFNRPAVTAQRTIEQALAQASPYKPTERSERRAAQRVSRAFMIRYRRIQEKTTVWLASPVCDLSSAGVRFFAEIPLPLGSAIDVWLLMPSLQTPVQVQGKVIRTRGLAMGLTECAVSFQKVAREVHGRIDRALARYVKSVVGNTAGLEQRRVPRIKKPLTVRFRVSQKKGAHWASSQLMDLSSTGMRFLSEEVFSLGVVLELQIQLQGFKEVVTLTGKIVRMLPKPRDLIEYGIRFDHVNIDAWEGIEGLVQATLRVGLGRKNA